MAQEVAALLRARGGAEVEAFAEEIEKLGLDEVIRRLTRVAGRSIATHGLPPMSTQVASRFRLYEHREHKEAKLRVKEFAPLRECPLDPSHPSILWQSHQQEEGIMDLVARALNDIISASKKIMENALVHGQVYDHMKMLRSFHGLQRVFGIATTYEEWRVCWLDTTDNLARVDTLHKPAKDEDEGEEENGRVLHASCVYKRDDPALPSILTSVIHKMHYSLSYGLLPEERRPRIHMNAKAWRWAGSCNIDYNEMEMPPPNAQDFVLLEDFFGYGADGRVWKACTQQGKVCVLKFAHARPHETSEHRQARLQEECNHWKAVWGMEARVIQLIGDWALLMPYVRPLLAREITRPVQDAIDAMAAKGCHEDLMWRYVGCVGRGKKQRVVFFDLGRVKKMEQKEATKSMLQQLLEDQTDLADD